MKGVSVIVLALAAGCGRLDFGSMYDAELIVTTTSDVVSASDDELSLREALTAANASADRSYIGFESDLVDQTFLLGSALPVLASEGTLVDGLGVVLEAADGFTGPLLALGGRDNIVRGFELRGAGMTATGVHLRIEDLSILGAASHGIELTNAYDVRISRSTIIDVIGDPVLAKASADLEIEHSMVSIGPGSSGRGFVFEGTRGVYVHDNLIDPGTKHLVRLYDSPDARVIGNILEGGDATVVLEGVSTNAFVFRNVMISPLYEPMYLAPEATGAVILNNTFYMCDSGVTSYAVDTQESNTLDSDAGFIDPTTYDFRLATDSPAIDAAADVGQDMMPGTGERFLGTAPDLGAVETR